MSANKTQNSHVHRLRYRDRATGPTNHLRKAANYITVQAARMTAIVGVTSVTPTEIAVAHGTPPYFVRGRHVRGADTVAKVTALGINIL